MQNKQIEQIKEKKKRTPFRARKIYGEGEPFKRNIGAEISLFVLCVLLLILIILI